MRAGMRLSRDGAGLVVGLGVAQTLAWASSYYLPAMLAVPMARDLGVATPVIFAALSAALLISAALGPLAGRLIDRHGGRPVLLVTSVLFAAGLGALALAQGAVGLFAAWTLIGVAMGAGLYEAAFATLVHLHGRDARRAITGITLIAGFASTVGWPLTAWLEHSVDWRGACGVWAALHLLIGLPLHLLLPRGQLSAECGVQSAESTAVDSAVRAPRWTSALLATAFAVTWFTSTAMAAHLPHVLILAGMSLAGAVTAAALVGPAQVAARMLEFGLLRRVHPLLSARLASTAHPLGALLLMVVGAPAGLAFTILHGAGNGILTIAKGTLPLVLFGPQGYGARQGWLMVPARIAQAAAPLVFGLVLDHAGIGALWLSAGVGIVGCVALLLLHSRETRAGISSNT